MNHNVTRKLQNIREKIVIGYQDLRLPKRGNRYGDTENRAAKGK